MSLVPLMSTHRSWLDLHHLSSRVENHHPFRIPPSEVRSSGPECRDPGKFVAGRGGSPSGPGHGADHDRLDVDDCVSVHAHRTSGRLLVLRG